MLMAGEEPRVVSPDDAEGSDVRAARVLLRDGSSIRVRPVRVGDMAQLERLHAHMSADSFRHRFFGSGTGLAHQYLAHLLRSPQAVAMVGVRGRQVLGLGTAEPLGDGSAEVSFVVDEESHGLGLGTILLERLASEACARNIGHLVAEVMCENHEMLDVFAHAGFVTTSARAGDTVHFTLDTAASEHQRQLSQERRQVAERHARDIRTSSRPAGASVSALDRPSPCGS